MNDVKGVMKLWRNKMGEAKAKENKRREHAAKIVAAFEQHILSLTHEYFTEDAARLGVDTTRQKLIEVLITPPPK